MRTMMSGAWRAHARGSVFFIDAAEAVHACMCACLLGALCDGVELFVCIGLALDGIGRFAEAFNRDRIVRIVAEVDVVEALSLVDTFGIVFIKEARDAANLVFFAAIGAIDDVSGVVFATEAVHEGIAVAVFDEFHRVARGAFFTGLICRRGI